MVTLDTIMAKIAHSFILQVEVGVKAVNIILIFCQSIVNVNKARLLIDSTTKTNSRGMHTPSYSINQIALVYNLLSKRNLIGSMSVKRSVFFATLR